MSAPYYAHMLIEFAETNEFDLSSVYFYAIGGNPIGDERIKKLKAVLPNAIIDYSYGMTETMGAIIRFDAFKDQELREIKKKATGLLKPATCVKVGLLNQ